MEQHRSRAAGEFSEEEWQGRLELAACYRILDHFGITDLIATHVSLRTPGEEGTFLINPYGYLFGEVTASTLVKVSLEGEVLYDITGLGFNAAGFLIHGAIHEARDDARCILHSHTPAGIGVSCHPEGLLPITQHAMFFHNRTSYHDYEGIAFEKAERERLQRDLGPANDTMILRNHGLITCGRTVADALHLALVLERACQAQIAALAGGVSPRMPSRESIEYTAAISGHENLSDLKERFWNAMLRLIDNVSPSYKE